MSRRGPLEPILAHPINNNKDILFKHVSILITCVISFGFTFIWGSQIKIRNQFLAPDTALAEMIDIWKDYSALGDCLALRSTGCLDLENHDPEVLLRRASAVSDGCHMTTGQLIIEDSKSGEIRICL